MKADGEYYIFLILCLQQLDTSSRKPYSACTLSTSWMSDITTCVQETSSLLPLETPWCSTLLWQAVKSTRMKYESAMKTLSWRPGLCDIVALSTTRKSISGLGTSWQNLARGPHIEDQSISTSCDELNLNECEDVLHRFGSRVTLGFRQWPLSHICSCILPLLFVHGILVLLR
ncbi:hypothetical protein ARMGADRAFT_827180 [Armillaria gallica]|uniref:Uncharacterized protein n=1 Tax=Armillaria gallica TaxID=47427 RepID=A0A2H3CC20_ARMGA|nr:hypothetical protein ARMGADRAFT_827180 [Armillaria gallica]